MLSPDTIAVMTNDPVEDILDAANSAAWSINAKKWGTSLKYLVCVQRSLQGRRAFLVAKVSNLIVDTAASAGGRTKYAVEFREYALIDEEPIWEKSQNPVRIVPLKKVLRNGLPNTDAFREVGQKRLPYSYSRREPRERSVRGLSVAEAKQGLAERFGVPEEAITISIQM